MNAGMCILVWVSVAHPHMYATDLKTMTCHEAQKATIDFTLAVARATLIHEPIDDTRTPIIVLIGDLPEK
jgi:hypothetical protein